MELSAAASPVSSPGAPAGRLIKKVLRLLFVAAVAVALWSQLAAAPSSLILVGGCGALPPLPSSRWWWPFSSAPPRKETTTAARRPAAGGGGTKGPPAACVMFNFGDSNSDTGNLVAGAGFRLHGPVGSLFFGKPSGRFSDGRLYIDFICERLGLDHLSPYLESSGVSFRHGANFAAAGATAGESKSLFSLGTQVRQFRHLKARTADLLPLGLGSGITKEEFENAVYTFDIGQNDIQVALSNNLSYHRVLRDSIPAIITRIRNAVTMVHEAGGRKLVLYNTGPLGCLPSMLARRPSDSGGGRLDGAGCLAGHNRVARAFNAQLGRLCRDLRHRLAGATVVCVDMYAIKYGLVANHTAHGLRAPLMACCGSGGPPYNYRPGAACGSPKVAACADGDRRVSWDGLHYTEAANRIIADEVLSAEHSDPPLQLHTLCASPS
ncbi:hypothetical protein BS78_02G395500 [Paspalum vaginatum]|nr:hypothetical protein BS78_02G395500 [Paspalum vaginatum]